MNKLTTAHERHGVCVVCVWRGGVEKGEVKYKNKLTTGKNKFNTVKRVILSS